MKRIYASEVLESADEILLSVYSKMKKNGGQGLKQMCDALRLLMDTNKIIGLAKKQDEDVIYIMIYNVIANGDNYYEQHLDEEKNGIYIEVEETDGTMLNNETWTQTEKVCYIAHVWAEKEDDKKFLHDFDYTDMANTVEEFINSQPDNVHFPIHISNCFDVLEREIEGAETVKWTKEYFAHYY